MIIKTFAYRLYPSKNQRRLLEQTVETCRRFYNDCLAERKETYETTGVSVSKNDQLRNVKVLKATNPWAKGVHSHILQVAVTDLDKAFQAFFRRIKSGEKPGYPRFKSRDRFNSFGLKEYGNGFRLDGRRLKVSGVGRIPVRWHRELLGTVKTLRISRKADGWYAFFSCEVEPILLPKNGRAVGIDVGLKNLLTDSDGLVTENPRWYRDAQKRLRVKQRSVARKTKGGSNRRKAVQELQRTHLRVQRQRKDFLNKVAKHYITTYEFIALEDLRIKNMVRNPRLAKSILDAGWGYLTQRCTDKAAEAGRCLVLVNPAYTSRDCSICGYRYEGMSLSVRSWICPQCGTAHDRDGNASTNIRNRGVGRAPWEPSSLESGLFSHEAAGL